MRIINPFHNKIITDSVKKQVDYLCSMEDGGPCGISSEIIASVVENIPPTFLKSKPRRLTLPFTPAPTSKILEDEYYPSEKKVFNYIKDIFETNL